MFVASFTRAAAAELAGRDLPLDRSRIGTLHAHCYRSIGDVNLAETHLDEWNKEHPGFEVGETRKDMDDPYAERRQGSAGDESLSVVQSLRAQMVRDELWPVRARNFFDRWTKWKQGNDLLDFTDLLEIALMEFDTAPGGPSVGFFDESQDFSKIELALVRKWGAQMDQFILAGDDDQCLYNFRGATPDAFLNPPLPDEQKRVLSQSYRLRSKIHAFTEKWVRTLSYREEKEYRPLEEGGEIVSFDQATFKNPEELVNGAAEHAEAGRTVMILASCSYMLVPAVRLMREKGIPFHNPYRRKRGDWNPLHPGRGASMVDRMFALLVPSREGRMWTNGELRLWISLLDSKAGVLKRGAKELIKKMPDERVPDDELLRNLFEIEEFEKLLYQAEEKPLEWLASKMLKSKKKLMDFPMQIIKRYGMDALTEQPKITPGTIHSIKGGEVDVVYIYPDLSKAGMLEWIGSPVQRDSVIRQFYVGFTRARHYLYLCGPESRMRVEFR